MDLYSGLVFVSLMWNSPRQSRSQLWSGYTLVAEMVGLTLFITLTIAAAKILGKWAPSASEPSGSELCSAYFSSPSF